MTVYDVTMIPGDGIGPEVAEATKQVLEATGLQFRWDMRDIGLAALDKRGDLLPKETLDSIRKNKIGIKGPTTTPLGEGFRSVNVGLRQELGLFANLRPGKTIEGVQSTFSNIDLVVVRENMQGMYSGIEFDAGKPETAEVIAKINELNKRKVDPAATIAIRVITEEAVRKIARFAYDYARANKRKKVTIVHKANIIKFGDGLFLRVAQDVAQDYPDIETNDRIVDNMCMQLMQKPRDYDVLVMENLFGDIVSDLVAGMVGGLGVAPGGNIGDGVAVFEPIHGSAPSHAGKDEANPTAMILSGAMMLRHLGELDAAIKVEQAVADVIREGTQVTYDLRADRDPSKAAGTSGMTRALVDRIRG
jgi:isocitrate dehydrogenase (NAD+)